MGSLVNSVNRDRRGLKQPLYHKLSNRISYIIYHYSIECRMKDNKFWTVLILVIGFTFIFLAISDRNKKEKANEEYFNNWNIQFSGTVTEKKEVFSDGGILCLDINSTNIDFYDKRNSVKYYYCVIKNGKAELVEGGFNEINIGDSIVVDGKMEKIFHFRNSILLKKRKLYVSSFDPFYKAIKNLHKL